MLHHCQFTMYLGAPVKQSTLRLFLLLIGMSEAVAAFPPHKLQTLRSTSQKRKSLLILAVNYCHH